MTNFSSSGDDNNSPSQNFTDDTNISSDNISSNNIDSFDDFDEDLDFSEVDDWLFEADFEPFIGAKAYADNYLGVRDCDYSPVYNSRGMVINDVCSEEMIP